MASHEVAWSYNVRVYYTRLAMESLGDCGLNIHSPSIAMVLISITYGTQQDLMRIYACGRNAGLPRKECKILVNFLALLYSERYKPQVQYIYAVLGMSSSDLHRTIRHRLLREEYDASSLSTLEDSFARSGGVLHACLIHRAQPCPIQS